MAQPSPLTQIGLRVREAVLASAAAGGWGKTVGMGADGTPTKYIDDLAERVVLEESGRLRVDADILSEEAGLVERGGRWMLVADPVDGTHNAARGLPFYCVSLALAKGSLEGVEEGVVVSIPTGDVYRAVRGEGATLNGQSIRVRPWQRGQETMSIYLGPDAPPGAFGLTHFPKRVRNFGAAALELALVASGALDAYVQWGNPLRVTDIAAGALILREAGGEVYDLAGSRLDMPLNVTTRRDVTATGAQPLAAEVARFARPPAGRAATGSVEAPA
jgi:fructose-1,6-bisphosphatase/inositol monophosphatase family enzyme